MRYADLPCLRRFDGGRGSFRLRFRQRHQLSLDLRHLRLRFRNEACAAAVCLQLGNRGRGPETPDNKSSTLIQRGAMSPLAQSAWVLARKPFDVALENASPMSCIPRREEAIFNFAS